LGLCSKPNWGAHDTPADPLARILRARKRKMKRRKRDRDSRNKERQRREGRPRMKKEKREGTERGKILWIC